MQVLQESAANFSLPQKNNNNDDDVTFNTIYDATSFERHHTDSLDGKTN